MKWNSPYINKINIDSNETVTDQLLNMLLIEFYDTEKPNLKNYFKNLHVSDRKATGFESFVKCWVVLEKAVRAILIDLDIKTQKYLIPDFSILKERGLLTNKEASQLQQLRQVRNHLLHGIETPRENYLKNSYELLKALTKKLVDKVPIKLTKDKLMKELDTI